MVAVCRMPRSTISATSLFQWINRSWHMGGFIDVILSNKLYMIIAVCTLGMLVYFIIKKTIKLFLYAFIVLIAFLAFIYIFK